MSARKFNKNPIESNQYFAIKDYKRAMKYHTKQQKAIQDPNS